MGDSGQDQASTEPLPLDEAARRLVDDGRALGHQLSALRQRLGELVEAELALSRSALLRIGIYALLALLLAGSTWLCLLFALMLGLHALGCPAWAAALLAALLLLASTLLCLLGARRLLPDIGFRHSQAALRQLWATATRHDQPDPDKPDSSPDLNPDPKPGPASAEKS